MKSIRVRVVDGTVCVSAPLFASDRVVMTVLESKRKWIEQRLCEPPMPAGYVLFGRNVTVETRKANRRSSRLEGDVIVLYCPDDDAEKQQKQLDEFYKREIITYCTAAADRLFLLLGADESKRPTIRAQKMTSRWGSCNARDRIIKINSRLAGAPCECVDYVVAHELAHLLESGHGKAFYAVLSRLMPDYKQRRKRLNDCARYLFAL